jgi:hypothetical protein
MSFSISRWTSVWPVSSLSRAAKPFLVSARWASTSDRRSSTFRSTFESSLAIALSTSFSVGSTIAFRVSVLTEREQESSARRARSVLHAAPVGEGTWHSVAPCRAPQRRWCRTGTSPPREGLPSAVGIRVSRGKPVVHLAAVSAELRGIFVPAPVPPASAPVVLTPHEHDNRLPASRDLDGEAPFGFVHEPGKVVLRLCDGDSLHWLSRIAIYRVGVDLEPFASSARRLTAGWSKYPSVRVTRTSCSPSFRTVAIAT